MTKLVNISIALNIALIISLFLGLFYSIPILIVLVINNVFLLIKAVSNKTLSIIHIVLCFIFIPIIILGVINAT